MQSRKRKMNVKTLVLASVLVAFSGAAMAANAPVPPVKHDKAVCKMVHGKQKCKKPHKSPFKPKKAK